MGAVGSRRAGQGEKPLGLRTRVASWVVRHLFERGDFIETASEARLEAYGLEDPERVRYVATGRFVLPRILRRIGVGPDDVFLDFGSGKGRVVYQAAQFPFRRVIGVEIAEELNRVARYNLDHNRDRLACGDIELVTGDAVAYEVPADVTVVYLYHPFEGETFTRVIGNLVASGPEPAPPPDRLRVSDERRLHPRDRSVRAGAQDEGAPPGATTVARRDGLPQQRVGSQRLTAAPIPIRRGQSSTLGNHEPRGSRTRRAPSGSSA